MNDLESEFLRIRNSAIRYRPRLEDEAEIGKVPLSEPEALDKETCDYKAARASIKNDDMRLAAKMRRKSAQAVYWYLVGYSVYSASVILLQGFSWHEFSLPMMALNILIGSTAVSAIGLVAIVLRGLFPTHPRKSFKR